MISDPITLFPGRAIRRELGSGTGQLPVADAVLSPFTRDGLLGSTSAWRSGRVYDGTVETPTSVLLRDLNLRLRIANTPSGKGASARVRGLRGVSCLVPEMADDLFGAEQAYTMGSNPKAAQAYIVFDLPSFGPAAVRDGVASLLRNYLVELLLAPVATDIADGLV